MRKKPTHRRKKAKKRTVKSLADSRHSGALILMIWTILALFA
jgi:hypothetical protein